MKTLRAMRRWYGPRAQFITLLFIIYEVTMAAFTGKAAYWAGAIIMGASYYISYVPDNWLDRNGYKIYDAYMTRREARERRKDLL